MSKYPLRYRIFMVVACFHLSLMALGASSIGYSWAGYFEPALSYYGDLSGAGSSYGFFAPGVYSQLRALFDISDRSGQIHTVNLATGASSEADLRTGDIIDQFSNEVDDSVKYQRALSSSLAGTIFGRYPEAQTVNVRLEKYDPVSMEEYRGGQRAHWESVYQATYAISKDAPK